MTASPPSPTPPKAPSRAGATRRPSRDAVRPATALPARQPAVPLPKPGPAPQAAAAAGRQDKDKKMKLVRDSFTMPKSEYSAIDALKARAAQLGRPSKKSEMLRAGLQVLTAMPDAKFLACLSGLPAIKTGRPAKPKT